MNRQILSPKDQLDDYFTLMRNVEIDSILEELKKSNKFYDFAIPVRQEITSVVNYMFFIQIILVKNKYKVEAAQALEMLLEKCSMKFCSFVTKLELGTLNIGFNIGKLERLPDNFNKLINLRKLYLNGQPIEDLSPLKSLELNFLCAENLPVSNIDMINTKRMHWLNLDGTNIKSIDHMKDATGIGMQKINIPHMNEGIIETLLQMKGLTTLVTNKNLSYRLGDFVEEWAAYKILDPVKRKQREVLRDEYFNSLPYDYVYVPF